MQNQMTWTRTAQQAGVNTRESVAIDVVRAIYSAYERQDLATILNLFHPEGEIWQTELLPWGGLYHGRSGLELFLQRLTGAIETRIEDESLIEAGDQIISIGHTRGRVRRSGARIDLPAVHVYTVQDGLVRRYEAYVDTPGMLLALHA